MSGSYFMNIVRVSPGGQIDTLDEYYADDDLVLDIGLTIWDSDECPPGFDWRWCLGFDPVSEAERRGESLGPKEQEALMAKQPGHDDTYDPQEVVRGIEYIAQAVRRGTHQAVVSNWRIETGSRDYNADVFSERIAGEIAELLDVCRRAQAQSARLFCGYVP